MTSTMGFFQQSYLHKTSVHTLQETKSSQKTVDLPWAHLEQNDCKATAEIVKKIKITIQVH